MRWLSAIVLCAGATAAADSADIVGRPLVLARGDADAEVSIETNLAARTEGRPLSLSPDVWFGATSQLTVGLVHSQASVDQIGFGGSLCLRSSEFECDRVYEGGGLDARYEVVHDIAPRVRLLLRDVSPAKPATTIGALARWRHGRFAITGDPYVRLGLANRDRGNRAAIVLPVWFAIQPTCHWAIALQAGYASDLAVLRDGWRGPLGLATEVAFGRLAIGAEFGFPSLIGPQNNASARALRITLGWRQHVLP